MKQSKPCLPYETSSKDASGSNNLFSLYFQAHVKKELCWMVSATLKYVDHVAFDRTLDKNESLFEFFVSPDLEGDFLDMMHKFVKHGIILEFKKIPNRFVLT